MTKVSVSIYENYKPKSIDDRPTRLDCLY